jgi:hypothetical protein
MPLSIRILGGFMALAGLAALILGVAGKQSTVDLIVGKGDRMPEASPEPGTERYWLAGVGVVLLLGGLVLLFGF